MIPDFDPVAHKYSLGGRRLWSVTQILTELRLLKDLSFLDSFYRERGSAVHACIALAFAGKEVDWDFDGAEHVRPRFERFVRLREAAKLRPILFEQALASTAFGYAGTPDYFGPFYSHPFAIVDWKGDASEPGHRLQIAGGYRGLLYEAATARLVQVEPAEVLLAPCFLVPLGGESDMPRTVTVPDEDGQAMNLFRAAAALWNWRIQNLGEPK